MEKDYAGWVKDDETIEDLRFKDLKLIQKKKGFRFGMDAVLLAHFTIVKKGDMVLDLGTGTGIIPVLIAVKTGASLITAVEILPEMAELAMRNAKMNGIDSIGVECIDLKEYKTDQKFDVVTANPPYMNMGGGLVNPQDSKAVSRHEIKCTLEDVIRTASHSLKHLGRFNMVHRPQRLTDIICSMRRHDLEPKQLRFVHPSSDREPSMILIRGLKSGRPMLKVMPPLFVRSYGEYTAEIRDIYNSDSRAENK